MYAHILTYTKIHNYNVLLQNPWILYVLDYLYFFNAVTKRKERKRRNKKIRKTLLIIMESALAPSPERAAEADVLRWQSPT